MLIMLDCDVMITVCDGGGQILQINWKQLTYILNYCIKYRYYAAFHRGPH